MKLFTQIIFLLFFISHVTQSSAQNKSNAGGVAAGVVAGGIVTGLLVAASVENVKEGMERNVVEWIYDKYKMEKPLVFELKLIKWEVSKKEDLNNISVVGYKFYDFNNPPQIILTACSPGWVNDYGINFDYVTVYEINQEYWSKLILKYLNMNRTDENELITDIEKIPVKNKKGVSSKIPFYFIKSINSNEITFSTEDYEEYKFTFKKLYSGDVHIGSDYNDDFKLDINEGHLNLFLKSTGDLVRIKRDFIVDITRNVFENKIPLTVN